MRISTVNLPVRVSADWLYNEPGLLKMRESPWVTYLADYLSRGSMPTSASAEAVAFRSLPVDRLSHVSKYVYDPADRFPVHLDERGRLHLLDGHLRVASLLAKGHSYINCVVVSVSEVWSSLERRLIEYGPAPGKRVLYQQIDHPYFDAWGVVRHSAREAAIARCVESAGMIGGVAVDVGCCTGSFSRILQQKGMCVYGVDSDPNALFAAEVLNGVFGSSVSYLNSWDVLAVLDGCSVDVILCLSVMHHWLGSSPDYYLRFLRFAKSSARLLIMDMDGHSDRFPVEDVDRFSDWLRKEIGFSRVERVPIHDYRPILACHSNADSISIAQGHRPADELMELSYWRERMRNNRAEFSEDIPFRFSHLLPGRDSVSVLEIGSGPVSRVGTHHSSIRVELLKADVLGDAYNDLMDRYGVCGVGKVLPCSAEHVGQLGRTFDIVVCENALDHMEDPRVALLSISSVAVRAGFLVLGFFVNAGSANNDTGMHQWDINEKCDLLQEGRLVCNLVDVLGDEWNVIDTTETVRDGAEYRQVTLRKSM